MGQLFSGSVAWQEEMMPAWVPARTNEESRHNTRLAKDQKGNDKVEQGTKVANSSFTTGEIKGDHNTVAMVHEETNIYINEPPDDEELRLHRAWVDGKIHDIEDVFVETEFLKKLQKELLNRGVVTLTGIAGEGKTTMAIKMCQKLKNERYIPMFYETIDDVQTETIARVKGDIFIVIDDFLGKCACVPEQTEKSVRVLRKIIKKRSLLRREGEQASQGNEEARKPLLLLLLSRDNVFEQAVEENPYLEEASYRVNVSSKASLLDSEKGLFLKNYSKRAKRSLTSDDIKDILKSACPLAFPRICQLYAGLENPEVDPAHFFDNPKAALVKPVHRMMNNDPNIKAALALLLFEGVLPMKDLEDTGRRGFEQLKERLQRLKEELPLPTQSETSPFHLVKSLKAMCGGLLVKECGFIGFSDDSVRDAVSFALAKNHIAFVARHCSLDFITQHVHVSKDTCSESIAVILEKEQWGFFLERLIKEAVEVEEVEQVKKVKRMEEVKDVEEVKKEMKDSEEVKDVKEVKEKEKDGEEMKAVAEVEEVKAMKEVKEEVKDREDVNREEMNNVEKVKAVEEAKEEVKDVEEVKTVKEVRDEVKDVKAGEDVKDVEEVKEVEKVKKVINRNLESIFKCPLNKHPQFLNRFIPKLMNSERFEKVVHSRDKKKDLCFLFWMSLTPSPNFEALFHGRCFDSDEIWQAICGCCMTGQASEIEFLHKQLQVPANLDEPVSCLHRNKAEESPSLPNIRQSPHELIPSAMAAACDHPNALEKLVQLGISVNAVDSLGRTPLIQATMAGQGHTVKVLVDEYKADTEIPDRSGSKPLHWAIQLRHTEITNIFIEKAIEANDKEECLNMANERGQTLLMLACGNMPEVALHLLHLGAKADEKDKQGRSCLHYACLGSDSKLIQKLIQHHGINVNTGDKNDISPLHQACYKPGNQEMVRALLSAGADPHMKAQGMTPLHLASTRDVEIVRALLEKDEKFDDTDSLGLTPLMYACLLGNYEIVKLFLEKNADVKLRDESENTVLHFASIAGCTSVVELLLEKRPTLLNDVNRGKQTAFFFACAYGQNKVVRALIEKKTAVDKRDKQGRNALHAGAAEGLLEIIKLLLDEAKLDIDSKDNKKMTPLMFACFFAKFVVVYYLSDRGADTICADERGNTALHFAAADGEASALLHTSADEKGGTSSGGEEIYGIIRKNVVASSETDEMARTPHGARASTPEDDRDDAPGHGKSKGSLGIIGHLLDKNCMEADVRNNEGNTPMLISCLAGNVQELEYLIKRGADPYVTDNEGNTAYHHGTNEDHLSILEFLNKNTNLCMIAGNKKGETPLELAVRKEKLSVTVFLVKHTQEWPNKDGNYPLHTAAMAGNIPVAKAILDVGRVSVDIRNKKKETPLHLASQAGKADMVRYLIQKGASTEAEESSLSHLPLHLAVIGGHLDIVKILMDANPPTIDAGCKIGRTPLCCALEESTKAAPYLLAKDESAVHREHGDASLHVAARRGYLTTIKALVKMDNMKIDIRNNEENTPMLITCATGNVQELEYLIKKGADPSARDIAGNTAYHHGSHEGHLPILEWLKENTKLPMDTENKAGETPLIVAIRKKNVDVINFLVQNTMGSSNEDGNYPLHVAVRAGNMPVAKAILDVGLNPVDIRNKKKETPLHLASQTGKVDMVRYLIQNGASTEAEESSLNHLPLHLAAIGGHLDTVKILMDANPAAIDAGCGAGRTPLCHALEGSKEVAVYLMAKDKSAVHREHGDTSLHVAAKRGHLTTVKTLVEKRHMETDVLNNERKTPLHCACAESRSNVVSFLIEKGASQTKCCSGDMPLHLAAKNGDLATVKTLVEEGGASVSARNNSGCIPLQLARDAGKHEVVNYLRERAV